MNVEQLINKLSNISNATCTKALTDAAMMVEAEAKVLCPVDDGQLRQSITSNVKGKIATVGTNVEYAPYVEFGTGIYAAKGDGRKDRWSYQDEHGEWHSTIGQMPNPFLETALDNKREDIIKLFRKEIRESL